LGQFNVNKSVATGGDAVFGFSFQQNYSMRSDYVQRYLYDDTGVGSILLSWIDDDVDLVQNRTILTKVSTGDAYQFSGSLLSFSLTDNETNIVNVIESGLITTNVTNTLTLNAGRTSLINKSFTTNDGDSMMLIFSSTIQSTTGLQTPMFTFNVSDGSGETVYLERTLLDNSDIGNAYIFHTLENLTNDTAYIAQIYLTVEATEQLKLIDESLTIIETELFNTTSSNLPPSANNILSPLNGTTHYNSLDNFTWESFGSPDLDTIYYNATIINDSDGSLYATLRTGTTNVTINNYTLSDTGNYTFVVLGYDSSGATDMINSSFELTDGIISCQTFNSAGTFNLANDISNNTAGHTCMVINSSNVVLDCNSYKISSDTYGTTFSIMGGIYGNADDNVTIKNCVLNYTYSPTNSGDDYLLNFVVANSSNLLIDNNTVLDGYRFLAQILGSETNITNNDITLLNNDYGSEEIIYSYAASENINLINNTITTEDNQIAFRIENTTGVYIGGNTIAESTTGINIDAYSPNINITNNNIYNATLYSLIIGTFETGTDVNAVIDGNNFINCENECVYNNMLNTITANNSFNNCSTAVQNSWGNGTIINNIIINSREEGVYLGSPNTNFVDNNNITNSTDAGILSYSDGSTISNNIISGDVASTNYGITSYGDSTTINNNVISGSNYAMLLSNYNNVTNNTATGNTSSLWINGDNNTIVNNTLRSIRLQTIAFNTGADYNLIYNNLLNTSFSTYVVSTGTTTNYFNCI
jgi:parallel beta-helix repeat protein